MMKSCMVEKLIYLKKRDRMTTRELSEKERDTHRYPEQNFMRGNQAAVLSSVERLAGGFRCSGALFDGRRCSGGMR